MQMTESISRISFNHIDNNELKIRLLEQIRDHYNGVPVSQKTLADRNRINTGYISVAIRQLLKEGRLSLIRPGKTFAPAIYAFNPEPKPAEYTQVLAYANRSKTHRRKGLTDKEVRLILDALQERPRAFGEIGTIANIPEGSLGYILNSLVGQGKIRKISRGLYAMAEAPNREEVIAPPVEPMIKEPQVVEPEPTKVESSFAIRLKDVELNYYRAKYPNPTLAELSEWVG